MSIDVKVLNCNANCPSCYEARIRENYPKEYDINAIIKTLKEQMEKSDSKYNPTIHGGEPLLLKISELEKIFKIIYEKHKSTGIQTNLLLLNDKHIKLFKKYNTHVGVSLDGRTTKTNKGREYDPKPVLKSIHKLHTYNINMSLIIVLRKYNVHYNNLDEINTLSDFILFMSQLNITDFRCNPGIIFDDKLKSKEELTCDELIVVFRELMDLTLEESHLMIQPFRDVVEMLMGFKNSSCGFWTCDPYCTGAEIPIMHDGTLGNCLKPAGAVDGIVTLRDDMPQYERYEMLKQLPQNENGCKGCKYWFICHGGCPGAGVDNDWRNKTRFCDAWYYLFEYVENKIKGLFPNIYLISDYYPHSIDSKTVFKSIQESTWMKDKRISLETIKKEIKECRPQGYIDRHGDIPHGDHTDKSLLKKKKCLK